MILQALKDNKVVHKSARPGIGKTFIIFLLAELLKEDYPQHEIYVTTISKELQEQIELQGQVFGTFVKYLLPE